MEDINSEDIKQQQRDWIKRIHDYRNEASSQFNKQLVYLCGGGLILTIGFAKDIVNFSTATFKWLLICTWLFFTLSLLLNLVSHKSTMKAMDLELNHNCDESDKQDIITNRLDMGALISLIFAILVFVFFVSLNIL